MECYLHIGAAKAGSTALQRWCAESRSSLRGQGVWYPKCLGKVNHTLLWAVAADANSNEHHLAGLGIYSDEVRKKMRLRIEHEFERERAQNEGCRACIVSNEYLQSRMRFMSEVQRVYDFLAPHFTSIKVVLSLRPQVDVAVSRASTTCRRAKRVNTNTFLRSVNPENPGYDYDTLVKQWERVWGRSNVTVVPYKREPSLVAYFIKRLELDSAVLPPDARRNEALDYRAIALANGLIEARVLSAEEIRRCVMKTPVEKRLQIGRAFAQMLQSRFEDKNRRLSERRQDIEVDDLTPDWSRYELKGNLHVLDQKCAYTQQLSNILRGLLTESKGGQRRVTAHAHERCESRGRVVCNVTRKAVPSAD